MSLIHLLYPKKCPVCGSAKTADEKDVFCPDCYKNLIWVEEPCCKHCGKPVASEKVELCYDCGRRDSQLRQGTALWVYDDKGKQMMHLYKYTGQSVLSEVFGRELIKHNGSRLAAGCGNGSAAAPETAVVPGVQSGRKTCRVCGTGVKNPCDGVRSDPPEKHQTTESVKRQTKTAQSKRCL